jgi:hypothetical protein
MVTGPTAFIQRIDYVSQAANLHTSGLSQVRFVEHSHDAALLLHLCA